MLFSFFTPYATRMLRTITLALPFFVAASAQAATFTVTKTADTNDSVCDADCSLRDERHGVPVGRGYGGPRSVHQSDRFRIRQGVARTEAPRHTIVEIIATDQHGRVKKGERDAEKDSCG